MGSAERSDVAISCEGQLADLSLPEHSHRFAEQPTQLLDRDRLHVVMREVDVDEVWKGKGARDPLFATNTIERICEPVLLSAPCYCSKRVVTVGNGRWSLYGAHRSQPVATGGK